MPSKNNPDLTTELIALLNDSGVEAFKELASNIKKSEDEFFAECADDFHKGQSHSLEVSVSTDWDFYIDNSQEFSHTFTGSSREDVINKMVAFYSNTSLYDNYDSYPDKPDAFIRTYLPEMAETLAKSDDCSFGGNWEIDCHYQEANGVDDKIYSYKLLGVTLSSKLFK